MAQQVDLLSEGQPFPVQAIRVETVLSRLPIHILDRQANVTIRIVRYGPDGSLKLYWEVLPNEHVGSPRLLAYEVDTLIVNRRIDELSTPQVPQLIRLGSLREIAQELGKTIGRNLSDIQKALDQNASAYIKARLTYHGIDGTERRLEARFTRYSVILTGKPLPDGTPADAVYLLLNEPYREILTYARRRPLDYAYLKQLPPLARRFYEILSYRIFAAIRNQQETATLSYAELCQLSTQKRYVLYRPMCKQMSNIHKPHFSSGYLRRPVHYTATTDADGQPDWIMHYTPGPKAYAEYEAFNAKAKTDAATDLPPELPEQATAFPSSNASTPVPSDAQMLLEEFFSTFHHRPCPHSPNAGDLTLATTLLRQHDLDVLRFWIRYSHEQTQQTTFRPRSLAGIRTYLEDALQEYAQRQHQEERRRQITACPWCNDAGLLLLIHPEDLLDSITLMCPHDEIRIQQLEAQFHKRRHVG